MLRGTEKWVTYFVLLIVFIFGIVLLSRQIGLTTDLKHSLTQASQLKIYSGDLKNIVNLHTASSRIFFLTFFALCLLIIGVVIIVRGTERAYDIADVKEKVRYHLRGITPGIVLVVLSSFLLAFCAFRSSHIETVYSSKLIDYNNFKIASQTGDLLQRPSPVPVDTSSLNKLKSRDNKGTVNISGKSKKGTKAKIARLRPTHSSKKLAKKKLHRGTVHTQAPSSGAVTKLESKSDTHKTAAKSVAPNTIAQKTEAEKDRKGPPNAQPDGANEAVATQKTITPGDIKWAEQFQRNVTIYGYVPNASEQTRFSRILEYLQVHGSSSLNRELTWAYLFLEKTKNGYEPKAGEMQQYERIIQRNVKSAISPLPHGEL